MSMDRRQTTILAADMVGYSRLMAADEEGVITRLRTLRAELIDPAIADHQGRIVKTMGDGMLVEFADPAAAARMAVAVQRAMNEGDTGQAEAERIRFRIGINAGEVVADGDDILGDAVNIAARLETLSPPGGVCVSRAVHERIGAIDIPATALGPQYVKNIPEPVEVWRLDIPGAASAAAGADGARPSIAILPFDNMSADPDQEFLADGIVEDVTTALSRFRWLFVIARNSAFSYRGKQMDVREIAKELGVRYVVEGSVRRAGDRLRVTAQLIDAETGAHVWADRWDRTMADLFELQDELTAAVIRGVAPEIGAHERNLAVRKPTENLSAWELVHRGLAEHAKFTPEGFAAAQKLYEASIAIDPRNAMPYAMLARMKTYSYLFEEALDPRTHALASVALAEKAVAVDERSDDAYAALGQSLGFLGRKQAAIDAIDKGLSLNVNNPHLYHFRAVAEVLSDDPDPVAIIRDEQTALGLSPKDPVAMFFHYHLATGRLSLDPTDADGQALSGFETACRHPNAPWYLFSIVAALHAREGRLEKAATFLETVLEKEPGASFAIVRKVSLRHELWATLWPSIEPGYRALIPLGLPEG
jgi:TolB-like protein